MPNNKRILCLGNNTIDTDFKAKEIAINEQLTYHGLITSLIEVSDGCYHTSLYDLSYGEACDLLSQFDVLVILDQSKDSYLDSYTYSQTIKLAKTYKNLKEVVFVNQRMQFTSWDVLEKNKSFCILPFIGSITQNNNNYLCCWSSRIPVSKFDKSISFNEDPSRQHIKKLMIAGGKIDNLCDYCYNLESKNVVSPRVDSTVEWMEKLKISHESDAEQIDSPVYYEIRANNTCNLMCRTCQPQWSSMIQDENSKINLFADESFNYNDFSHVNLNSVRRLYVAGGEPSIMREFHSFLQKCIDKGRTDFEIIVNTNAIVFSEKFKNLISSFSDMRFEISVDSVNEVNSYIRWPTKWSKLNRNIEYLHKNNYQMSFNIVVSIYSISTVDQTIDFLSSNYPNAHIHLSHAHSIDDILSPYNFPNTELVLQVLNRVKEMPVYKNTPTLKSKIDEFIDWFSIPKTLNFDMIQKFFKYNDALDQSRNVKLIDYIPELEECRKLITKPT